ncbi:MAG: tetratricopeptide repeat protein [Pyrinomonadaceae bacterium]
MHFRPPLAILLIALFATLSFAQETAVDHYNRGIEQRNDGEYEKAIAEFTKAIQLDAKMADAYYERGSALLSLETDPDGAMRDLSKVIELDKKYSDAYFNRGTLYQKKKEWDKAIADFTSYILLAPRDYGQSASGLIERGKCLLEKNDFAPAIADFTNAVIAYPKDPAAYRNRAIAYEKSGNKPAAEADRKMAEKLEKPSY